MPWKPVIELRFSELKNGKFVVEAPAPIAGSILLICGLMIIIIGLMMLVAVTLKSLFTILRSNRSGEPAGGSGPSDWATLAEAMAKLPIWAIALLAGDVQIWLGLRLLGTVILR